MQSKVTISSPMCVYGAGGVGGEGLKMRIKFKLHITLKIFSQQSIIIKRILHSWQTWESLKGHFVQNFSTYLNSQQSQTLGFQLPTPPPLGVRRLALLKNSLGFHDALPATEVISSFALCGLNYKNNRRLILVSRL